MVNVVGWKPRKCESVMLTWAQQIALGSISKCNQQWCEIGSKKVDPRHKHGIVLYKVGIELLLACVRVIVGGRF